MNSASYVKTLIQTQKNQGVPLQTIAWNAARACVGMPYVYGAVGEECKPAKRRQYGAKFYPKGHTTIVTKCQALGWDKDTSTCVITGDCAGCKWNLPVLMYDCRGFTRKILNMVYGWTLMGGTVGGQWNDERNWKAKGEIATMPKDTLVCLFVYNSSKKNWAHTGFGLNNMTVEASSGVQYFSTRNKKWTHWAVPAVSEADVKQPEPTQDTGKQETTMQTIRKGNKGVLVKQMQTMLDKLGYSLGICGVDGDFGVATEKAVKEFQRDHQLAQDGICGPKTWTALQAAVDKIRQAPAEDDRYTVTITGLTKTQAEELSRAWTSATVKKE